MSSVRKAPRTGRWEARYRDPNGRQRTKTFDTKTDARAFLATIEVGKQRGEWVDPQLGRITLSAWSAEWWATTVGLRASTRARDEATIRNHVLPAFGARPLTSIGQLEVQAWVKDLELRLAPASVAKAYQLLSKMLRAAVMDGRIPRSPAVEVDLPTIETEEMRIITPDEIAALADAITPRYRALVLLGSWGGLRIGEMAGLRRDALDLLHSKARVVETAVEVHGNMLLGPPKTKAGRRTVPLAKIAVAALEEHLGTFGSADASSFVFAGRDDGILRPKAWRTRHWIPATKKAGVDPLRPHDMRHTAISLWIKAGFTSRQIATWAGHTSVSVVLDRYGHLFPGDEAAALDRLDVLAAGPVAPSLADIASLEAAR